VDKTVFFIRDMDCPSEEQVIRLKLADSVSVKRLEIDLENRRLTVFHTGELPSIQAAIDSLNYGASLVKTESFSDDIAADHQASDKKLLWIVLIINFSVFAVEIIAGIFAHSMGLVADSLDELADALVYALSLYAIAGTAVVKKRIARSSGVLQVALAGNAASLYFLRRTNTQEVHIKATQIFTSNDVIVNLGVIVAAILVALLHTEIPDLVVGIIVFGVVIRGAVKIFKLSK
jgi:Co/Zn/Cd efflux system component